MFDQFFSSQSQTNLDVVHKLQWCEVETMLKFGQLEHILHWGDTMVWVITRVNIGYNRVKIGL